MRGQRSSPLSARFTNHAGKKPVMQNDDIDWDAEFADDPDYQALTPAQRDRLLSVMDKHARDGDGRGKR